MRQQQRRIEPLANRQHGSPLPFEHRFEKLVLAASAHRGRIHAVDRFIEQRLQLIAELGVAEQVLHFFRLGWFGGEHECQMALDAYRSICGDEGLALCTKRLATRCESAVNTCLNLDFSNQRHATKSISSH